MKAARPVFFIALTLALTSLLNSKLESIPPLGKFLSPFTGFWQNAESAEGGLDLHGKLKGLKEEVAVKFDEQRVPHIFAKNDHDLYFMQGYLTARDRLWQMEFMTHAAGGRISEVFGSRALEFDRNMRRIGIPYAAKAAIEQLETDSIANNVLTAYSKGVNAYIQSLSYKKLPLEYKLLNYEPEAWSPYNCALLLKYMANMLTGKDYDFEYSNALQFLDKETFDLLFPDFPPGIDPIVPAGFYSGREVGKGSATDVKSVTASGEIATLTSDTFHQLFTASHPTPFVPIETNPGIGSNNWAIAGGKSASGKPILCNDPHLRLQLPSIWYQQQLHAPGINVYGVTIPGAPGVTLGFNEHIAWGVTNGSMDVKDWYQIEFKDDSKNEYLFDGKWLPAKKVIEEIRIRDEDAFYDTVIYTQHGPVTHDENFNPKKGPYHAALRWTAHDPSNELKVFYLLNRAKNYDDYLAALDFHECPGQNIAFASANGDIAIKQQGKFILREGEEGKFMRDGTVSSSLWKGFIPFEENPHVKNPERGFISSANQHPTDSAYPYYYNGIYEYYRNRRINNELSSKEKFSVEDMMKLQTDNYNMLASEILPYLLTMLSPASFDAHEKQAFDALASWNFFNDEKSTSASYFTLMWEKLYELLWDEFLPEDEKGLTAPDYYNTVSFMINHPEHPLTDNQSTAERETLKDLVPQAFKEAVSALNTWIDSTGISPEWADYKGTELAHYIPGLEPFNVKNLPVGGNLHIVNATSKTHGASWRMVVELGDPIRAWGIYPGGQSGNPGSHYYSDFAMKWARGEYFPLLFLKDAVEENARIISAKTIKPAK